MIAAWARLYDPGSWRLVGVFRPVLRVGRCVSGATYAGAKRGGIVAFNRARLRPYVTSVEPRYRYHACTPSGFAHVGHVAQCSSVNHSV